MPGESKASASSTNPLLHGLSGSVGGVLSSVVFQPLDVIKTRQQQEPGALRGMGSIAMSIVRSNGILALWRGTMPTIYRTLPGSAIYFSLLNAFQTSLKKLIPPNGEDGQPHRWRQTLINANNLVAGASARAMAGIILNPVTVVKARYESNLYTYKSTWDALVVISRQEGLKGLFSGAWATVYRDAPYAGLYVLTYERLKVAGEFLSSNWKTPQMVIHFGSGMLAGFTATLATQPFDVIKTRAQVQPSKYPSFSRTISLIFQEQGFSGFFRGIVPRLVRKSLTTAFTWTMYEEAKRLLINKVL